MRALVRGLSILGLFDVDHREWTIDEIAEQTGLLRMTAYRMVRTLESVAFLVRDTTTNHYHLGPAAITMAYVAEDNSEFVEHARPFLEELLETTGNRSRWPSTSTACPCAWTSSTPPGRSSAARRPGRILGDLVSVHGKIFAAFAPPERRAAVLAQKRASTRRTPSSTPRCSGAGAERVAAEDVAYDEEGLLLSTCAVGSPVRDQLGNIVAAISVVMPTGRFGPEERDLCTRAVKDAAASLSAYLGWNPSRPSPESPT